VVELAAERKGDVGLPLSTHPTANDPTPLRAAETETGAQALEQRVADGTEALHEIERTGEESDEESDESDEGSLSDSEEMEEYLSPGEIRHDARESQRSTAGSQRKVRLGTQLLLCFERPSCPDHSRKARWMGGEGCGAEYGGDEGGERRFLRRRR
jgi:hypothetical protein